MADTSVSTSDLESPDHAREVRMETVCERIGWVLIVLVLIAALLGLLGPGPLSYRKQTTADGSLSVDYNLIERYEAPAELRMAVDPPSVEEGEVRLSISRSFVDEVTPQSISPVPIAIETVGDRMIYTFKMKDLNQQEGRIVAKFQIDEYGVMEYDVGLEGRETMRITQYVLP
jgi:hypothetical protein